MNGVERDVNQAFAEGMVSIESRKGWGWEYLTGGGITVKVAEISENELLDAGAGGVKNRDQGPLSLLCLRGGVVGAEL